MPLNTPKSPENRFFDNFRAALRFACDAFNYGWSDAVKERRERLAHITQNQAPESEREPDTEGLEMMKKSEREPDTEGLEMMKKSEREPDTEGLEMMKKGDITLDLKNPENAGKFQEVLNVLLIITGCIPDYLAPNMEEVSHDPQALFDWADALKSVLEGNSSSTNAVLSIVNTENTLIVLTAGDCSQDFCMLNLDKRTLKMTFRFENGIGA